MDSFALNLALGPNKWLSNLEFLRYISKFVGNMKMLIQTFFFIIIYKNETFGLNSMHSFHTNTTLLSNSNKTQTIITFVVYKLQILKIKQHIIAYTTDGQN